MLTLSTWILTPLLAADNGEGQGSNLGMLPAIVAVALLMYFFIFRSERQKQKAHRQSLEALKKNDRVVTIGGIYGVVTNVQRESDEVTLKVDEATNAKLRVTLGAIARIVSDEADTTDKSTKSTT